MYNRVLTIRTSSELLIDFKDEWETNKTHFIINHFFRSDHCSNPKNLEFSEEQPEIDPMSCVSVCYGSGEKEAAQKDVAEKEAADKEAARKEAARKEPLAVPTNTKIPVIQSTITYLPSCIPIYPIGN